MKVLTTVILMMVSVNLMAQIKGITPYKLVSFENDFGKELAECNEKWVKCNLYTTTPSIFYYYMFFKTTPVGLKHTIKMTTTLLELNGKDFDHPDIDNSLLPSWSDNIYDYSGVNIGVKSGDAEIRMFWDIPGYRISLISASFNYSIVVVPEETLER